MVLGARIKGMEAQVVFPSILPVKEKVLNSRWIRWIVCEGGIVNRDLAFTTTILSLRIKDCWGKMGAT